MRVWPKSLCVDVEEAGVSILGGGGTSVRDTQILLLSGRHTLGDSQIWQDVRTYNNNKKSSCTGKIDWKENMLNKQQCRWNSLQQHTNASHYINIWQWEDNTLLLLKKKGYFVWFIVRKYMLASTIIWYSGRKIWIASVQNISNNKGQKI